MQEVEPFAREVIGRDIEVEFPSNTYRGPIKIVGVEDVGGESLLYFNLEWIAKLCRGGWELHQEEPDDLTLGARLFSCPLNLIYGPYRLEDGSYELSLPHAAWRVTVYPPENSLNKQDLKSL